jgi:hypothetical protein
MALGRGSIIGLCPQTKNYSQESKNLLTTLPVLTRRVTAPSDIAASSYTFTWIEA